MPVEHNDYWSNRRIAELEHEVNRLVVVEKAARVYFREFDHLVGREDYPERRDLREALHPSLACENLVTAKTRRRRYA